jgi:hypothetical protein
MRRPLLGSICGLALLMGGAAAFAADSSDTDMAERYTRAAKAGDDQAQFYLGALYSAGTGVRQSDAQAFEWISRAAQQGNSQAMIVLGALLAIGRGAQRDTVSAYKWAYIVGEASHIDEFKNGAHQLMGLLETRMSPAEISKAKSDAERFRATKSQSSTTSGSTDNVGSNPVPPSQPRPTTAGGSDPGSVSSSSDSKPASASAPSSAEKPAAERDSSASKASRNPDVDQLLNQVPQGLRQKYGF